ncbi:MAG: class I SAM-dependent methyltransferase [Planctomycetes bacterium]|nr:class I SAM-dependent methyltransferase [Planctomycetota bacterium]
MEAAKQQVHDFWQQASCGESLYLRGRDEEKFLHQMETRYQLEPYILEFADFARYQGRAVLEIGVGLGADHQQFAEAGADLTGIDLTERAVRQVRDRFQLFGLHSDLRVMDAENLEFPEGSFDLVYSWGVLHHTPDTARAVREVRRVLKPGGEAKVMIYHTWSMVGLMLWLRYGLLRLRPWISWAELYSRYLESPGTKAYTVAEARQLFAGFRKVSISVRLTHGDLLTSEAGQRHRGPLLRLAKKIWPRAVIRRFFPQAGLFLLIHAVK